MQDYAEKRGLRDSILRLHQIQDVKQFIMYSLRAPIKLS
jgi:hypothetical protein